MKQKGQNQISIGLRHRHLKLREPNVFIEAKQKMSREEMILWLYSILSVQPITLEGKESGLEELIKAEKPFKAVARVNLRSLAKYIGEKRQLSSKATYRHFDYLREVILKLVEKVVFEIPKEPYKKVLEEFGFSYLVKRYHLDNEKLKAIGVATIEKAELWEDGVIVYFTEYVAPLIVQFKKWFTTYHLDEIIELESRYSLILYRIARENLGLKREEFTIPLEELKWRFDTRLKGNEIKAKILNPAIEEINKKTSVRIEVEPIRRGRGGKIVAYRFKVKEIPRPKPHGELSLIFDQQEFKKKLEELLKELANDLSTEEEPVNYQELAYALLRFERVNPAVAIWFLLHYPKGEARFFAWKHISLTERDPSIKHPDRFLKSLIQAPKEEYSWLLDQRVKDLVPSLLEEIAKELIEKQQKRQKAQELYREIISYVRLLPLAGKREFALLVEEDDIKEFLNRLVENLDIPKLEEILQKTKELYEKYKDEIDDWLL
ncbi:MAG TPA: RepB family plasmid replication initiator protein [Aquificales bacterium]|nr:RepB family plasmid replication initiator protein [Aquificales bacterium]